MGLDPADYICADLPTAAAVKDLVNGVSGDITPLLKCELLDVDYNPKVVVPVADDDPTLTNDITRFILSCTHRKNRADAVQGSADLLFLGELAQYVTKGADSFRLWRGWADRFGNRFGPWFPCGTYLQQAVDRDIYDTQRYYTLKVFDESIKLGELFFKHQFVPPRGVPWTCLLRTLLMMDYRTPEDGGRAPTGIVSPCAGGAPSTGGSPIGKSVQAFTVCSRSSIDGLWHSPAGPYGNVLYSSYDGTTADVLHPGDGLLPNTAIDSVTYAPYSPWTLQPMFPVPGQSPEYFLEPFTKLFFKPATGEFSLPQLVLGQRIVVDPFKEPYGPYPGLMVQQTWLPKVLPAPSPWNSLGTVRPPLGTFPNDYDRSGPYYQTSPSTPVTTSAPTTLPSGSGVLGSIPGYAWARRYGDGLTTLVPTGHWSGSPPAPAPDPAHPATNFLVPLSYNGQEIIGPSVDGWSFPAGTWEITFTLSGLPGIQGGASATIDTVVGGSTVLGNIPAPFVSFSGSGQITLVATGTYPAFTGGAGDHIKIAIDIQSTALTAALDNAAGASVGSINLSDISFTKHPDATVPSGVTYVPTPVPATPLLPSNGPTHVPWPDTGRPAQNPSGCGQEGPNVPPERIDIPDYSDAILVQPTFGLTDSYTAACQQCTEGFQGYPLAVVDQSPTRLMMWTTKRRPYYLDDGLPEIAWKFSNDPDAVGCGFFLDDVGPITERPTEMAQAANDIFVVAQNNTDPNVIWSELKNDDLDSNVSRVVLKRTIHRIIQQSTIGNQAEADAVAKLGKQQGEQDNDSISFPTHGTPMLHPGDAIHVFHRDPETLEVNIDSEADGNPYIIESIETQELLEDAVNGISVISCSRVIAT